MQIRVYNKTNKTQRADAIPYLPPQEVTEIHLFYHGQVAMPFVTAGLTHAESTRLFEPEIGDKILPNITNASLFLSNGSLMVFSQKPSI